MVSEDNDRDNTLNLRFICFVFKNSSNFLKISPDFFVIVKLTKNNCLNNFFLNTASIKALI